MAKKKIITLHFRSGNNCDVIIGNIRFGGVNHINVQWDVFPPSWEDQVEWKKICLPELCEGLAKLGLIGESQLEAFCTSGDSPGKEGSDDR